MLRLGLLLALLTLVGGCGDDRSPASASSEADDAEGTDDPSGAADPTAGPAASSTSSTSAAGSGAGPQRVVVVGDSLTEQADEDGRLIQTLEGAGYEAEGGGVSGLDFAGGYERWRELSDRDVDVLVVALGTNDAEDDGPERVRSVLTPWLEEAQAACVVLVGVNETTEAWELDVRGPAINAVLADVAAGRGDAHVQRWAPASNLLTDDGIHLTDAGRAAYRRVILEGVLRC